MKIDYAPTARQAYMMRNPTPVSFHNDSGAVGPHALTARWTQSVPANKIWVIESILVAVRRITVAAPIGLYTARLRISDAGAPTWLIHWQSVDNTVNYFHLETLAGAIHLNTLASLTFETEDLSTGGTLDFVVSGRLYEYEA